MINNKRRLYELDDIIDIKNIELGIKETEWLILG